MRYITRSKIVTAIQWRGWPHRIKGIEQNPVYPQLATLTDYTIPFEIYRGDWIVTEQGKKRVMRDTEFKKTFKKI